MRVAIFTLLLGGCSLISDLDGEKCSSDSDCAEGRTCSANNFCLLPDQDTPECSSSNPCQEGEICAQGLCEPAESARWGCVDELPEAPMTSSEPTTLRMRVQKREGGEAVPVGTATAVACEQPSCDQPIGPFNVESSGAVDIVVNQGFQGFIRLKSPGLLDTLYQLQAPINVDSAAQLEVVMFSTTDVGELAEGAGVALDTADRAVVVFQVLNCLAERSDDMSVLVLGGDPSVDTFYLAPNGTALSGATSTSAAGVALATDVPTNAARFSLVRTSNDMEVESLEVATLPGVVTYVPYQFGK